MNKPSKLTSEYQATIPKDIRTKLGLEAGDYVMFHDRDGEITITKVENIDWQYLKAVSSTLEAEWLSDADAEAYADL